VLLPTRVEVDFGESIRDYWLKRALQHTNDRYAGVPLSKFPEDLRVYEHLLWAARPNTVIEIGTDFGGSALWFRDRLASLTRYGGHASPRVISIDIDIDRPRAALADADPEYAVAITLVEGNVLDPQLPTVVAELLMPDARCFIVEDSAHTYETTYAALDGFSRFVATGGFFVVEDGCVDVDEMRASPDWPRGVLPALHDWLKTSAAADFDVRRDLEIYGISCHPEGFLQRR
jgi:cephalosporin hydroxylase